MGKWLDPDDFLDVSSKPTNQMYSNGLLSINIKTRYGFS